MIGEKILGYTVDEKIGSGGFGTVYRVSKSNASGTYVRALKHITIPSQKQYADVLNSMGGDYSKADDYFSGVLKEIVNEIQIISTLSEAGTQNIVRYYENDIVESESPKRYDIYILMECLTPFTDYLYQNELKVKDIIKLGKDILTALVSCHAKNVIHRDIKDDNIFISVDGTYKLGDFGVSKMLKDRSRAESMKGTPNFIAPEVYLGKEQYDDTVDIYSLGIVLYKLLNKSRNPFLPTFPQAYNSNDEDLAFERRMKCEVPELPYDAQNGLGEAIIKAICKRTDRYDSAKEFLDALVNAERQLTTEELEKVVNQVIAQPQKEISKPKVNSAMNETIGTDMDTSLNKKEEVNSDRDLFETLSDTYDRVSKKVAPLEVVGQENESKTFDRTNETEKKEVFNSNLYIEKPEVSAVNKADFRWVAYVLPFLIIIIYIILLLVIVPNIYGKGVSFGKWLYNNPEKIVDILEDQNSVFVPIYKIWGVKIGMYFLWACFIASLFNFGRAIQNKKPKYNEKALIRDKEAYFKAMDLYEMAKSMRTQDASSAKNSLRMIADRLRNESGFGIGTDLIISCETDIAKSLKAIEEVIPALNEDKTAKEAGSLIVSHCRTIQSKLNIRRDMKKKRS